MNEKFTYQKNKFCAARLSQFDPIDYKNITFSSGYEMPCNACSIGLMSIKLTDRVDRIMHICFDCLNYYFDKERQKK